MNFDFRKRVYYKEEEENFFYIEKRREQTPPYLNSHWLKKYNSLFLYLNIAKSLIGSEIIFFYISYFKKIIIIIIKSGIAKCFLTPTFEISLFFFLKIKLKNLK